MTFKHIVLPGGACRGVSDFAALSYYIENGIVDLKCVETIHGTSVGSVIAMFLCLPHTMVEYKEYLINCAMDSFFYIDPDNIMNIMSAKCLLNPKCIIEFIEPFFHANNISLEITLEDFYKLTNKTVYMYATQVSSMSIVSFSHLSHPQVKLLDALQGSCSIPILCPPIVHDGEIYIDGGIISNYPLKECLELETVVPSEVLGVKHVHPDLNNAIDLKTFNVFDLVFYIIGCIWDKFMLTINNPSDADEIMNKRVDETTQIEVIFDTYCFTCGELMESISSKEYRRKAMEIGYEMGREFYEKQMLAQA